MAERRTRRHLGASLNGVGSRIRSAFARSGLNDSKRGARSFADLLEQSRGNLGSALPEDPDRSERISNEGRRLSGLELNEKILNA